MNKKTLIFIITAFICLFSACSTEGTKSNSSLDSTITSMEKITYQKITAEQAKSMMEDGNSYILLDVRTDEEFKEKRIDGAILIPDYNIGSVVENVLTDKNARILIYCRSGRRSALAANEMIEIGYTKVYDFGGIIDWPYDTVNG